MQMFTAVTERYSVAAMFGCQLAAPVDKMGRRPQGYVGGRLLPCSAQARAGKDSLKCLTRSRLAACAAAAVSNGACVYSGACDVAAMLGRWMSLELEREQTAEHAVCSVWCGVCCAGITNHSVVLAGCNCSAGPRKLLKAGVAVSPAQCWRLRCLKGCCFYLQSSTRVASSYDRVWSCRRLCGHRDCLSAQPFASLHDRLVTVRIPLSTNGQSHLQADFLLKPPFHADACWLLLITWRVHQCRLLYCIADESPVGQCSFCCCVTCQEYTMAFTCLHAAGRHRVPKHIPNQRHSSTNTGLD